MIGLFFFSERRSSLHGNRSSSLHGECGSSLHGDRGCGAVSTRYEAVSTLAVRLLERSAAEGSCDV